MKTQLTVSSAPHRQTTHERFIAYFAQHPTRSALVIFLVFLATSTSLGLAAKSFCPNFSLNLWR